MQKNGFKEHLNDSAAGSAVLHELTQEESKLLKQSLLEMYRDVAKVCTKYGLTIMLSGGSALGCIRHQGFIPWDDDLDLSMTRPDYEKFKNIFNAELSDEYILCSPNYEGKAKARFPKVIKKDTVYKEITDCMGDYPSGLFLDIFIIDQVPENRFFRKIKGTWCNALMFFSTCAYWYEQRTSEMFDLAGNDAESLQDLKKRLRIGRICSMFMPAYKWFNKVDKAIQYNGKSDLFGIPTGRKHYFGEIFRKDKFLPGAKGIFENTEVLVPEDYDAYLKNLYGEFMKLPPEDKRERHFVVEFKI